MTQEELEELHFHAKRKLWDTFHAGLAKDYPVRDPSESERQFFRAHPDTAGYAAEDRAVVLNPWSANTPEQQESVAKNERVRQYLRATNPALDFPLAPAQEQWAAGGPYGSDPASLRQTILARILSGDPSLAPYSTAQQEAAHRVVQGWTPR